MPHDSSSQRVLRWIQSGPSSTDGTIGWLLGMWLWWRIWATMLLIVAAVSAALWLSTVLVPPLAALASVLLGIGFGRFIMAASPRYTVETNY